MERRRKWLIALWLVAVPAIYWAVVSLFGFNPWLDCGGATCLYSNLGIQSAVMFAGILVLVGRVRRDFFVMASLMMASLAAPFAAPLIALMVIVPFACLVSGSCL